MAVYAVLFLLARISSGMRNMNNLTLFPVRNNTLKRTARLGHCASVKSSRRLTQAGLTLVEVMIAMGLGLFVLQGMLTILGSSKALYEKESVLTEMFDTGNAALTVLNRDLRRVGFFGSSASVDRIVASPDLDELLDACEGDAAAYDFNLAIWGSEAETANVLGCIDDAIAASDKPSDILVVKYVGSASVKDLDGDLDIDVQDGIRASETYVLSNNEKGIVFDGDDSVPSVTSGGDVPFGVAWPLRNHVYYIGKDDSGKASLKRKTLSQSSMKGEVVVRGVEAMRILYGEDSDGDFQPERYLSAADVDDWNNVIAAKIFMLVQSQERCDYVDPQSYQLGDITVPVQNDNFRRTVVEASVNLRNLNLFKRVSS